MRGGSWRTRAVRAAAGAVAVLMVAAACAGPDPITGPPVPTFPLPSSGPAAASAAVDAGQLADDCRRLLPVAELGALLGLPLDTVAVRTTLGVPAPSVGRTERIDCDYTGTTRPPVRGRVLLDINAAAYADATAARAQWRTNADVEDGDHRELPLGAASAVLVERPGEAMLMVVYGSGTLTVLLPDGPRPPGRPRNDVLIDLTLRLLPALAAAALAAAPTVGPAESFRPTGTVP